jgi:hypothetical protein
MYKPYDTEEEAETAAKTYAKLNGSIDFDGMNCNDYKDEHEPECTGWDGDDRRCDCGNRRVYWEVSKNSDGKFYAVAIAY